MAVDKEALRRFYALIALARTPREAKILVEDLFTPKEIQSLAERWELVQALAAGMTQREISKKLKISISKVTRGSRAFRHGGGGFKLFLWKTGNRYKKKK
jgi:Trp operon repressor